MKKLFILLMALGATQTQATLPPITVKNSSDKKIIFVAHHPKSYVCNVDRTRKEVLPGKTITFAPGCAPTYVTAIPEVNGMFLDSNIMDTVPKNRSNVSARTSNFIDVKNKKGNWSFEIKKVVPDRSVSAPVMGEENRISYELWEL